MNTHREPSHLNILTRINGNIVIGVLIDPTFWVNVIIEEIILINFLHKDGYYESQRTIRTHDGIYVPSINSITLKILQEPNTMNGLFDIILRFDLFRVKLGIPGLVSMNAIPLMIHKCLKLSHEGSMHVVHDTGYKSMVVHRGYSLDHYQPTSIGQLPPRMDLLYHTYIKYKNEGIASKLTYLLMCFLCTCQHK